jgi:hypothetical protein
MLQKHPTYGGFMANSIRETVDDFYRAGKMLSRKNNAGVRILRHHLISSQIFLPDFEGSFTFRQFGLFCRITRVILTNRMP